MDANMDQLIDFVLAHSQAGVGVAAIIFIISIIIVLTDSPKGDI